MLSSISGGKGHFLEHKSTFSFTNFTQLLRKFYTGKSTITVKFHERVTAFVSQLQVVVSLLPVCFFPQAVRFKGWPVKMYFYFEHCHLFHFFLSQVSSLSDRLYRCFSQVQEIQTLILNIFFLFCQHSLHFLVSHIFLVCLGSHKIIFFSHAVGRNKKFPLYCMMCITLSRTV